MKKNILFTLIIILFQNIGFSQSFNHEEKQNNRSLLLGKINKEGLSTSPYADWFTKGYDQYTPDITIINTLKEQLSTYTITAFMGTWCGDSKREIPRLYKILEEAQFPLDRFTLIAVSRSPDTYKQSPGGEHEGMNIHRVPTIIIYKDGKEVNRIVESPVVSLEQDILNILENNYTSNHYIVTLTNQHIEEFGAKKFLKKSKKSLKEFQAHAQKTNQLNTYANVLFYAGQTEKALTILTFNTMLFPNDAKSYMNLGNKQSKLNQWQEALASYQKASTLEPTNKKITAAITTIEENMKNTNSLEE
ncbi:tetratricopeptide repeat protein [uncultured Dokdonia sp.]|uniref:tetratricopeptide repeat protein n=1 Tax=uncultured Dokdonia sp. TaxID=575653 RepID=UPI002617C5A8|nr:tetratricopeptide repeat protein [uncultured Dokdonia sp.]